MTDRTVQQIRHLQALGSAFTYASEDVQRARSGNEPLLYHLDFGLLHPQLFSVSSHRSHMHIETAARVGRILSAVTHFPSTMRIAISGPTFVEFMDQLAHLAHEIKHGVRDSISRLSRGSDEFLREALKTSRDLQAELKWVLDLIGTGADQELGAPVTRLMSLLETGSLIGLEDAVGLDASPDSKELERLLNEQRSRRPSTDRRTRSAAEAEFHYLMDVLNVLITQESARSLESPALFVSQTFLNLQQCQIGSESYGRSEYVPLVVVNASSMIADRLLPSEREAIKYLKMRGSEGIWLSEELRKAGDLDKLPASAVMDHTNYYDQVSPLLAETRPSETPRFQASEGQIELFRELASNKEMLSSAIDEQLDAVQSAARTAQSYYESTFARYMERWNLDDDPMVKRIRQELNLS